MNIRLAQALVRACDCKQLVVRILTTPCGDKPRVFSSFGIASNKPKDRCRERGDLGKAISLPSAGLIIGILHRRWDYHSPAQMTCRSCGVHLLFLYEICPSLHVSVRATSCVLLAKPDACFVYKQFVPFGKVPAMTSSRRRKKMRWTETERGVAISKSL